ncbi:putative uncharacterized protein encoded by LINC00482 [Pan paniscus]|uniref:putative uncharacterized protein encoded by LINC00482 n=1 Tax=Pan paniscus TaxID=9597 RepID=UPI0030053A18
MGRERVEALRRDWASLAEPDASQAEEGILEASGRPTPRPRSLKRAQLCSLLPRPPAVSHMQPRYRAAHPTTSPTAASRDVHPASGALPGSWLVEGTAVREGPQLQDAVPRRPTRPSKALWPAQMSAAPEIRLGQMVPGDARGLWGPQGTLLTWTYRGGQGGRWTRRAEGPREGTFAEQRPHFQSSGAQQESRLAMGPPPLGLGDAAGDGRGQTGQEKGRAEGRQARESACKCPRKGPSPGPWTRAAAWWGRLEGAKASAKGEQVRDPGGHLWEQGHVSPCARFNQGHSCGSRKVSHITWVS